MKDLAPLPDYSRRHLNPDQAAAYRLKFRRGPIRRLSARRERLLVTRALDAALARVPAASPTLLDYPCGAGRFAPLFAGRVAHYVAGDHSPHMLAIATQALREAGLADRLVRTVEGDARHMDLEDDAVDLVCCMRLLHHFPERDDRLRILSELRRVSRGPAVTSFLDAASFKQRRHVAKLRRRGKASRRVLLTPDEFAAEAAATGWRLVDSWALSGLFSGQRVALLEPSTDVRG
ncbi:MAG: class I SAM-dependent methyltransferase [Planctomycetota bacterium]|nr:class I SAM-dependent methyltransferase [Planctomycetota bacterium]